MKYEIYLFLIFNISFSNLNLINQICIKLENESRQWLYVNN